MYRREEGPISSSRVVVRGGLGETPKRGAGCTIRSLRIVEKRAHRWSQDDLD